MKQHMFICLAFIACNALFGAASSGSRIIFDNRTIFNTSKNEPIPTLQTLCAEAIVLVPRTEKQIKKQLPQTVRPNAHKLIGQLAPGINMIHNERFTGPLNIYTNIVLQKRMQNNPTRNRIQTFSGHPDTVDTCITLSYDSLTLASGSDDKAIKLWDIKTGTCTHIITDHNGAITALAFTPDGTMLASASCYPAIIKLRNAKTGECLREVKPNIFEVNLLAFSSDNELLAIGSATKKLNILNIKTDTCVYTLENNNMLMNETFMNEISELNPLAGAPLWSKRAAHGFSTLGLTESPGRNAYNADETLIAFVDYNETIHVDRLKFSPSDLAKLQTDKSMQTFLLNATSSWRANKPYQPAPEDNSSYHRFIEQFPECNKEHFFTVSANDNHLSSLPENARSNKKQRLG